MYIVLGCSNCESVKIAEADVDTTVCNRCRKQIDVGKARTIYRIENLQKAKEARSVALAKRNGFDDIATEIVEGRVVNENVGQEVVDKEVGGADPEEVPDISEFSVDRSPGDTSRGNDVQKQGNKNGIPEDTCIPDQDTDTRKENVRSGINPSEPTEELGGIDEREYAEKKGLDAEELDGAGDVGRKKTAGESKPQERIVRDAVEFLEKPSDDDVVEFAVDRGVDGERAVDIVDELCMSGEAMRTREGYIRLL
ncbi:MAG: DUF5817 domain-containing protein [Halobacteria archaeon]